jgi:signal transduction histidine kinase
LLSSRLDAVHAVDRSEDVDLLAVAAEEAARYEHCSVTGETVVVRGDRGLLQRMVRNLLDNAWQHGVAPISVDVSRADGAAMVLVSDHGPGIAPHDRERIFTPFYRACGGGVGTGLGLTLVRQIARQHGGDASWTLTPAGLNAIRVVVPCAPGAGAAGPAALARPTP